MTGRTTAVYMGDHVALTRTRANVLMYVDTRDISLAPQLIMSGDWETAVTQVFAREIGVAGRKLVLDVGANFGWYTTIAASRAPQVIAFEPNQRCAELLRQTILANGWSRTARVVEAAVGDTVGEATFRFSVENTGGGRIVPEARSLYGLTVPVTTIDECVRGEPVGVIKLDIEGGELKALMGATETIAANKPRLFIEQHRPNADGIWDFLSSFGYRTYWINGEDGWGSEVASVDELRSIEDAEMLFACA